MRWAAIVGATLVLAGCLWWGLDACLGPSPVQQRRATNAQATARRAAESALRDPNPAIAVEAVAFGADVSRTRGPAAGPESSDAEGASPGVAAAAPARSTVTVVLHWDPEVGALGRPQPQLVRMDGPQPVVVRVPGAERRHPALLAADGGRASEDPLTSLARFEVEAGRYLATWYAWRPVSGTRTWRPCRGDGQWLDVRVGRDERIELHVSAEQLALDPELDEARSGDAWNWTEKDGD